MGGGQGLLQGDWRNRGPGGDHILADETGDEDPSEAPSALLVDDVEQLRTLYGTLLEERSPFEVVAEAGDGATGVERAREHEPDLVLLDLSMPDMDGLEALPRIREASPESDVVVLSGFLDDRLGEKARELGAADFIEKGIDAGDLLERVAEAAQVELREPEPDDDPVDASPAVEAEGAASQEVELLARGIRHDLQEPLQIMSSYLDLLEGKYRTMLPPEAREYIDHATDAAERMQTMVDALGEYGKVHSGVELEAAVDLDEILDDVVENLGQRLRADDVEFTRDHLPVTPGDRGNLMRVLQNLVGNALDYQGDGARVHVGCHDEGDRWVVTVADAGPGVPEGEQEEIFAPLRRGAGGLDVEGTGMGLAICRRIVEQHGGEIGVDSEPGQGATFWFTLPKEGIPGEDGEP